MRIVDLLKKDSILLNGSPKSKSEAIDLLVELQVKGGNIADRDEYKKGFWPVRQKVRPPLARGLRYLMPKARQLRRRRLRQ